MIHSEGVQREGEPNVGIAVHSQTSYGVSAAVLLHVTAWDWVTASSLLALPVSQVVRSIVDLSLLQEDTGVVNVCSGKPISIRKFVEDVLAEHNAKMRLNLGYYDYPDYEPMAFWGTRNKLDQLL